MLWVYVAVHSHLNADILSNMAYKESHAIVALKLNATDFLLTF